MQGLYSSKTVNNSCSTDTDSAAETAVTDKNFNTCPSKERVKKRRSRRARTKLSSKREDFKLPHLPGHKALASSTESGSGSTSEDSNSSETDSDSCSSASSSTTSIVAESTDDEFPTISICSVCQRPQNRNLKDMPELFIQCYTCRRKVHSSCVEMPHRMAVRVRNYNWQCVDCKCCVKCKRRQDQNKMLFCEQCDRGYHIYCLGVKAVPDYRWSCERCSICMRCGATKPEGMPVTQQSVLMSPNGEKLKQVKHKKVKWINEYRIDHITKLREHCSMLCVPCGRMKSNKRVQIATQLNTVNTINQQGTITSPLHNNVSNNSSSFSPNNNSNARTTNTIGSLTSPNSTEISASNAESNATVIVSSGVNHNSQNSIVTTSHAPSPIASLSTTTAPTMATETLGGAIGAPPVVA
uniref:PHD-type domain-containing protein n=1 Tax=Glossina pallidipes TaxID=7398 RepID=A0A1A9ZKU2_GLOPL